VRSASRLTVDSHHDGVEREGDNIEWLDAAKDTLPEVPVNGGFNALDTLSRAGSVHIRDKDAAMFRISE
jgi:hypothetical protein